MAQKKIIHPTAIPLSNEFMTTEPISFPMLLSTKLSLILSKCLRIRSTNITHFDILLVPVLFIVQFPLAGHNAS